MEDQQNAKSEPLEPLKRAYNEEEIIFQFKEVFDSLKTIKQYQNRLSHVFYLIQNCPFAIYETDPLGTIVWANPAAEILTGYLKTELMGNPMQILSSGHQSKEFYEKMWKILIQEGLWSGEIWNRKKDGSLYHQWMWIFGVDDEKGERIRYNAICIDVSPNQQYLSIYDSRVLVDFLTQLPTKAQLRIDVERLLKNPVIETKNYLVLINIDRFSDINMAYGFNIGEELLKNLGAMFRACVRSQDEVYRVERGVFAILMNDLSSPELLLSILRTLREKFITPIPVEEQKIQVGVAFGVSVFPDDTMDFDELLRFAELAIRDAKFYRTSMPQFYSSHMNDRAKEWSSIRDLLHEAIETNRMLIYFQPQINGKCQLHGVEALVRWNHPERGILLPGDFIPYAEQTGYIVRLGYWIIDTMFHHISTVENKMLKELVYSINLSAQQISDEGFADRVITMAQKYMVNPKRIVFEITESQAMFDAERSIEVFKKLKKFGFKIALDDFGKGYSSLSFISRFPIDTVKIDRIFITDASKDEREKTLTQNIVRLTKNMKLKTVAEGVETVEDLDFALSVGCDYVQGFYIGKPMSIEVFEDFAHKFKV